ncbi:purine-nucleoside phosphorylase [Leucobacter luti]|uniref:Purine nucleoside phosphorylase n=1 Tax=Leucobacter luti TaxID=340320 RepID=A0A4R6RTT0_9MICO|nr:purine-nucleoside phosphorylase [Leucobacter luti]TDP89747.1 purine-nucleoside phosphorylase [Leucobacter luti]
MSQANTPIDAQLQARAAADMIALLTGVKRHDMVLTLGTGWRDGVESLGETVAVIPSAEIPGFSSAGVPGHSGLIRSIRLENGAHALIIGARAHLYEGRGVDAVAHGMRTAAAAGARTALLTNGAGGIDPSFAVGDVVLISDHLNLTAVSPLFGADFVDLSDLYSERLRTIARSVDSELREGVYVQLPGPHFETPAEIRALSILGGQLVGMSTSLEAITAHSLGMNVLGVSLVTNAAAGLSGPIDHLEVLAEGRAASTRLSDTLKRLVDALPLCG